MRPPVSLAIARLDVDREEFLEGLGRLVRVTRPKKSAKATLSFDHGSVWVRIGEGAVSATAEGFWPGEARVPATFVSSLAAHPPSGSPISIWVERGRLFLGGLSVRCRWQRGGVVQTESPVNARLPDVLRMGVAQPDDALKESGLLDLVMLARAECREAVEKAARALKALEITPDELEQLVYEYLAGQPDQDAGEEH